MVSIHVTLQFLGSGYYAVLKSTPLLENGSERQAQIYEHRLEHL
jgi:hypothetical protein